jgi:hypothetical protein
VFGFNFLHLILFCSFAATTEGQVQLEPDVAQSTDDKPFSSDTQDTETTKISHS